MFDALGKALLAAQEKDDERIQKRRSKRGSRVPGASKEVVTVATSEGFTVSKVPSPTLSEEEDDDDLMDDRGEWEEEGLVLLHMVGYAVGLTNFWRFPYLCYYHGGGAFVIPYFVFLLFCAYPFVYLELIIGQYARVGSIAAWKLSPLLKGIGICMTIYVILLCININSVLAWCGFYLFQTIFAHPLPWVACDNGFGRLSNGKRDPNVQAVPLYTEAVSQLKNWHTPFCREIYTDSGLDAIDISERLPGSEFFRGRVQRMWKSGFQDGNISEDNGVVVFGLDSPESIGEPNTDMLIALFFSFVVIGACVSRGIKLNGKCILVAVLTPYIVLSLLFIRASGLSGALGGVASLYLPHTPSEGHVQAWRKAAEQVFLSTGGALGVHLTCASHNKINHNILRDATITVIVNSFTSLFAATVIFMYLGHVELTVGRNISSFDISGPELVFEVMADVLGELAHSNFYSFCFYFMLFLVGLATSVSSLITARTAIMEVLPMRIKYKFGSRVFLLILFGFTTYCLSAIHMTRGGLHTFKFFETFVGSYSLILCAIFFLIGIAWIWGLEAVVRATEEMGIRKPGIYFQICWKYVGIIILSMIFIFTISDLNNNTIRYDASKAVPLPTELAFIGHFLTLMPIMAIPFAAAHTLSKSQGKTFKMKLLLSISPVKEHALILATGTGKRVKLSHYVYCCVPTKSHRHPKTNQVGPHPLTHFDENVTVTIIGNDSTKPNEEQNQQDDSQPPTLPPPVDPILPPPAPVDQSKQHHKHRRGSRESDNSDPNSRRTSVGPPPAAGSNGSVFKGWF